MNAEELVARRVTIAEHIERLTQEKQEIDEKLREGFALGKHEVDAWTLTLRANRRLNADRFTQRFPVAQYPHLFKPVLDMDSVKESFSPIELDKFYDEGSPVVVVK